MLKLKSFTLAELLIVIVIIGVIAVITISVINNIFNESEKSAKVKKVYSTFSNAMTFIKLKSGYRRIALNNSIESMQKWYETYLGTRLITTKVCYEESGCWNDNYIKGYNGKVLSGLGTNDSTGLGTNNITAILSDGTLISIDDYSSDQMEQIFGVDSGEESGIGIFFDINGAKEPNTLGKDIFVIVFTYSKGIVPAYKDKDINTVNSNCSSSGTGISCIRKYLN
ncbi:MAG: prepilin-type N-terminal cleavage/methylation domain-containing protein [Candidatus Gastranaerophilales bacterium]|nr:prepilin-type N-terminal cleavage/methylation domain-containing protein [Candidatus Gastranaerophilales bacterium]